MTEQTLLDKNSPIPLYYQLAEHLRQQIQSGGLQPGQKLPAERDLAHSAEVSRMTARQALAYLVRSGLVTVRHGVGAFVAEPKVAYSIFQLRSFTESMAQQGRQVSSQVLVQAVEPPPPTAAAALHLADGARALKLVRLRSVEAVPLLLETSYVAETLCPDLAQTDLTDRSLYAVLEEQYGLKVARAWQTFEATSANDYEQQIFALQAHVPMLLLEGVTYTPKETPLEYFRAVYRGDRCSFVFESRRSDEVTDSPFAQLSVRVS